MPVSFSKLKTGAEYTRPQLAKLWGFRGYEAISRGVVTPAGTPYIILFITEEKQAFLPQYHDIFEDGILLIEGETGHAADQRIVQAKERGDEIHLFHRVRHHMPFIYFGRIYLTDYLLFTDKPSRFRFAVGTTVLSAENSLKTEAETHGSFEDDFLVDVGSRRLLNRHISYERSRKYRAMAIENHGISCAACGFDFNNTYGADFACSYIEIHHNRPITELDGRSVNPETDLIPLCSNCHSMAHRVRGNVLTLKELKNLLVSKITPEEG